MSEEINCGFCCLLINKYGFTSEELDEYCRRGMCEHLFDLEHDRELEND